MCLLWGSCRVDGYTCIVHVCLNVVSRTGFCRYLSAPRVKIIILTNDIGPGGVGKGGGLGFLGRRKTD